MELRGLLESLRFILDRKIEGRIVVHLDSAYVLNGTHLWMHSWQKNGWRTKTGEQVLNQDIWKELFPIVYRLMLTKRLIFEKVKGHAGIVGNERADEIATSFADEKIIPLFSGARTQYEKMIALQPVKSASKASSNRKGKAYSYVSFVNGAIKTDKSWAACEKRVKGKKGAKYKKVFSPEEEKTIIREFTRS
jgi:ribonuclease HI